MVADAVAGAEVVVGVVVKGAPADAAGVLRVGGDLIVDAGVADDVFALAFVGVDGFGGEGVADELGVEIAGMVGLQKGEAEVVASEDVFEELAVVGPAGADAAGLAGGVECACEVVGAGVEVVVVGAFIDADTPKDDRGVVPIAANHAANVVDCDVLPGEVADVLPAWDFFEDEKADFVAGI